MTNQTSSRNRLGGSPAGASISRLCTLTLGAILLTGGAVAGMGQAQPETAKPAKQVQAAKPAAVPADKMVGKYVVHQSIEVGGRYTSVGGSQPMWDTLVNQGSGGRVLGETLEMRSMDPAKTPLFDTLSSYSTGYGGDPIDVTRLKMSKGRWYDFNSSFRRDRQYFDYNLLDNSLLSTASAATPALVYEPDSLHLFNTVRRNMDTNLTLLPLSFINFRAAFNHGTHEGPTYSSVHGGGDVQLLQWFRNSDDTYNGGVDLQLAPRTTLSYDQFYVFYKGDTSFQLAPNNLYPVLGGNGVMASLGVDTLATATCGAGANKSAEVVNGVANPYCSGTVAENETAPTRTTFPSEQLRFTSHYFDKVAMNARVLYSGGTGNINSFNETFLGLGRGGLREEIETGGGPNGQFATYKRDNVNADLGLVAELSKFLAVSEAFNFWDFRNTGASTYTELKLTGPASTTMITPLNSPTLTSTTTTASASGFLDQKILSNTAIATATVRPELKLSAGWRYKTREISDPSTSNLTWHENWLLLGAVYQPTQMVRLNVNFDSMKSQYASGSAVLNETTPATTLLTSNTFTREAPDKSCNLRAKATVKPAKWINFAVSGRMFSAKNDDPEVNHYEHNDDVSFAASIIPMEGLSIDFNVAHDDVFSQTDLCYIFTGTTTVPVPAGANNGGTCVASAANPEGSSSLYLGNGLYQAPSNFVSGSVDYVPVPKVHINAGARLSEQSGYAEQLNPLMVPGALQSRYVTPFSDVVLNIAPQWAWHGNWTYNGYGEQGAANGVSNGYNVTNGLPSRNVHGSTITLGVKYAF